MDLHGRRSSHTRMAETPPVPAPPPPQPSSWSSFLSTASRSLIVFFLLQFVLKHFGFTPSSNSNANSSDPLPRSAALTLQPALQDGDLVDVHLYLSLSSSFNQNDSNAQTRMVWSCTNVIYQAEDWHQLFNLAQIREQLAVQHRHDYQSEPARVNHNESESAQKTSFLSRAFSWLSFSNGADNESAVHDESGYEKAYAATANLTIAEPYLDQLIRHNASLYAHIFLTPKGRPHLHSLTSVAPKELQVQGFQAITESWNGQVWQLTERLNVFRPRPKRDNRVHLLSGERADGQSTEASLDMTVDDRAVGWWRPTLHIRLVHDQTPYPNAAAIANEVRSDYHVHPIRHDYVAIYLDYWWTLSSHLSLINESTISLPLLVLVSPIHSLKHRMERTMEESWRIQQSMGTHSEHEADSMKRILLESNPILLAVTFVVSILHSVFDFLAFSADISFFRHNKMGGISSRSVMIGLIAQAIVFLYLLDNETSYMILVSSGIGLAIESWKLSKAFDISILPYFPFIRIANKYVETNEQGEAVHEEDKLLLLTQRYDREAMYYLSWILYPLLLCYAVYSLFNSTHKSWYSFVISSLVGAVYLSGLIQSAPQLYINYKLQSVAHMPWRMLTYKFFNTIIDDLFAFVITMPTLHRLSAFRDDIVFIIFLYQRWKYAVDDSRVNEFGVTGAQIKEAEERRKGGLPPSGTATPSIDHHADTRTVANPSTMSLQKETQRVSEQAEEEDADLKAVPINESSTLRHRLQAK